MPADDELNTYYSNNYAPYQDDHGHVAALEEIVADARRSGMHRHVPVRRGMSILDVGCGGGAFLNICMKLGARVQGVEPSAKGVAACRQTGIPVFHGTLTDFLDVSDQTFDLITANHVVEHHSDPVLLLSEMRRVANPDGTVWFALPNAGCIFARALKADWHSADLPVHLQHFTNASVKEAITRAGLQIVEIRTESENSLSGSLALLLRQKAKIPSRLTRRLSARALAKTGWIGRRIDAAGHGEAILVTASPLETRNAAPGAGGS